MSSSPSPASFADDAYRPRVHYTAADTWINDPNGLVYANGVYHLFFQNNPYGRTHANMSWGHAISTDLTHWEDRPVAILCDEDEQIFSGSAVVDLENTSGLGDGSTPPMIAVYTSHYSDTSPRPGIEAQSLAYSLDEGQTWTKYAANPVLDRGSSDFRDPKVFRYNGPAGTYWIMVAVEALDRKVVFYRSENLIDWVYLSEFAPSTPAGRIWECPDLFELPIDGDPRRTAWVLIVNLNLHEGDGGSAGIFFIGDFDGVAFKAAGGPDSGNPDQPEWEWLDHGRDFYATVSFNHTPGDKRVLVGWMSNWDYARRLPTTPWRGAMSLPREATLHMNAGRITLRQNVVASLEPAGASHALGLRDVPNGVHPLPFTMGEEPCLIEATFAPGSSSEFGLLVRQGGPEATRIAYDTERQQLIIDRRSSGQHSFSATFPSTEVVPLTLTDGRLALQIYVDTSSIEVFAQEGLVTVTDQIFPARTSTGISLYSRNGTAQLISLKLAHLKDTPIARLSGTAHPAAATATAAEA